MTALHNWRMLLKPGGRMVVIDGFWFKPETDANEGSEQSGLFERFYSKEIRTTLPGWCQFSVMYATALAAREHHPDQWGSGD